ncbi:hypothetical protein EVAR_85464_1 [Eumeta japonica]|uniref:Uncharacterized protein n=1 Tax=Eumeta variegata TaxID=151549 RepID=A0A4C1VD67_EUMVA|nr:hypothetical protein EVAR_85464_1 [Eumeta japonica]
MNVKNEYYFKLFTINPSPTLVISARDSAGGYTAGRDAVKMLFEKLQNSIELFKIVEVEGDHDVHLKNPERIAQFIIDFLLKEETKSRL